MSWASWKTGRLCVIAVALATTGAALSACGFHPVYGSHAGATTVTELAQIRINPIPERVGQVLRNYLSDRMQPKGVHDAIYTLDVRVGEQRADLGFQQDSTITFSRLTLIATFVLRDAKGNAVLSGNARADNSYNQLEGGFPTLSAQDDARQRAALTVGDEIVSRLSLYLRNGAT
jgi:LPS-assembly lipoprotein